MADHRFPDDRPRRRMLRRPQSVRRTGPDMPPCRADAPARLRLAALCSVSRRAVLSGLAGLGAMLVLPRLGLAVPQAMDVRLGKPTPDVTRVVVDVSEDMRFSLYTLADPNRIIVDLPEVDWKLSRDGVFGGGGIVRAMRYGLFQSGNSRMVLDLANPAQIKQAFMLPPNEGGGWRLVIDLQATTPELFAASAGPEHRIGSFRPTAQPMAEPTPVAQQDVRNGKAPTKTQDAPQQDAALRSPDPRAGTTDDKGPQKGKPRPGAKPVIVIDPGHGGIDPGAIGISGVYEKNITLAAAREFRDIIAASGRYEVRLTRDSDTFLQLRDRMAIGRKHGAALFVSLHADIGPRPNVKGLSIYTLSEKSSDAEAAALADKENKADIIAGIDLSHESAEVTNILIELAQRETMNISSRIADTIIDELRREVTLLPRSHRFAGFAVLKAPDVPSVLVEMGYLSNPEEEKLLQTAAYRAKLGRSLLRAIDRHFANRQKASRT